MGGGRTAPNPSNEVDIYNPGTNSGQLRPAVRNMHGATSRPIPTAPTTSGCQAATMSTAYTVGLRWKSSTARRQVLRQLRLRLQRRNGDCDSNSNRNVRDCRLQQRRLPPPRGQGLRRRPGRGPHLRLGRKVCFSSGFFGDSRSTRESPLLAVRRWLRRFTDIVFEEADPP